MKEFSNNSSSHPKISFRTLEFFLSLRNVLNSSQTTIEQYLKNKVFTKSPHQITQAQFIQIVAYSRVKLSSFQLYEVFSQLKMGQTIPIDLFLLRYHKIDESHQNPSKKLKEMPSKNTSIQQAEKQLQSKLVKLSLEKLRRFVVQNGGMEIFTEFDDDHNGYLCKNQFNQLMWATEIKELKEKKIRQGIIKRLYAHYEKEGMSKENFATLFKVQLNQKQHTDKIEKPQPHIFVPPAPLVPQKPKQIPQNPKIPPPENPPENPHKKKNFIFQMKPDQPNFKKDNTVSTEDVGFKLTKSESYESNQADLLDIKSAFPMAYRVYRLGLPSSQQYQIFNQLEELLQKKQRYIDDKNPETSIGKYMSADVIFDGKNFQIFQMAASVLHRQKSRIGLAREIEPKDIIQGQIGDCYFLSSIASVISIYPEVISQKFLFSSNKAHFYAVKLFIDGEWKVFCTDDQFPCQYSKPVYAKPHGNEIWVLLLQKCWAKAFGSYDKIDSGTPTQGFRAITGAPTEYFTTQNQQQNEEMYERLREVYQKRYVATASGSDILTNMSEKQQEKIGLISNHAYSFLKFLNINGETVVKMRNPWGKTVWKGQWSFQSKKWTKELRDKYNYHYQPFDGAFYMPWNSFIYYFSNFVICRLDPTASHTSQEFITKPHKSNYFKIVVKNGGCFNFGVYQQSKRKIGDKNYEYSPVRIVVAKQDKGDMKYVTSSNKASHGVYSETEIEPGIHYIGVKMDWQGRMPRPCVLSIYGQQKVQIEEIGNDIAPFFKKGVIQSYALMRKGKVKHYDKIKIPQAFNEAYFSINEGLGYLRLKNPTNKSFTTTYSLKKAEGIKPIKPTKIPFTFKMGPHQEICIGFWISCRGYSYESSQSMQVTKW